MDTASASTTSTSGDLTERQARLIIRSAVDYAIVGLDLAGVITSWNVGAERIMGWPAAEAIGRNVDLFFTDQDIEARIPAAEMSAAVRHGRGIDERWHLRRDGTRFWANGEMMPLRAANDELEGYVKILRDRTEQHYMADDRTRIRAVLHRKADRSGHRVRLLDDLRLRVAIGRTCPNRGRGRGRHRS